MYRGGYPEPMNDPDYEENCDDITWCDLAKAFAALAVFVIIGLFCANM